MRARCSILNAHENPFYLKINVKLTKDRLSRLIMVDLEGLGIVDLEDTGTVYSGTETYKYRETLISGWYQFKNNILLKL